MEGLARKVMRGRYDPIPSGYSHSLRTLVAKLLVVEPAHRASVNDVLAMDAVRERVESVLRLPPPSDPAPDGVDLIKTIQVPRRFNDLTKNLPPSRYESITQSGMPPPSSVTGGSDTGRPQQPARPVSKPYQYHVPNAAEEPHAQNTKDREAKDHQKQLHLERLKQQQQREQQPHTEPTAQRTRLPQVAQQRPQAAQIHHGRHRIAPGAGTNVPSAQPPLRLPNVPGAQGRVAPPTPQHAHRANYYGMHHPNLPTREIRMVYHQPNGDSRVSIFQRRPPPSRDGSYYNPITHQKMGSEFSAGSRYHSRHQPYVAEPYAAQRRRVGGANWY